MDQLISTENVARCLGISRPTVIKYIQEDRLKAMRTGKAYKIARTDLVTFARQMGINDARIADLGRFLSRRDKKTRALEAKPKEIPLVRHRPPRPMVADADVCYYVFVDSGLRAGRLLVPVKAHKFFIGRHSLASLSITDPYVSALHTTLVFQDSLVKVVDQSTNGTRYGGGLLRSGQTQVLGDGDQFGVGAVLFTLVSPDKVDGFLGTGV